MIHLPQHADRRSMFPSPMFSESVFASNKPDKGKDFHAWLSGIVTRAPCTIWQLSTEHLVQVWGDSLDSMSDNLFVHVPQPTWETMMIPDLELWFSWTPMIELSEQSSCQLGQPMTPKTIFPSTTSAKPTWKDTNSWPNKHGEGEKTQALVQPAKNSYRIKY